MASFLGDEIKKAKEKLDKEVFTLDDLFSSDEEWDIESGEVYDEEEENQTTTKTGRVKKNTTSSKSTKNTTSSTPTKKSSSKSTTKTKKSKSTTQKRRGNIVMSKLKKEGFFVPYEGDTIALGDILTTNLKRPNPNLSPELEYSVRSSYAFGTALLLREPIPQIAITFAGEKGSGKTSLISLLTKVSPSVVLSAIKKLANPDVTAPTLVMKDVETATGKETRISDGSAAVVTPLEEQIKQDILSLFKASLIILKTMDEKKKTGEKVNYSDLLMASGVREILSSIRIAHADMVIHAIVEAMDNLQESVNKLQERIKEAKKQGTLLNIEEAKDNILRSIVIEFYKGLPITSFSQKDIDNTVSTIKNLLNEKGINISNLKENEIEEVYKVISGVLIENYVVKTSYGRPMLHFTELLKTKGLSEDFIKGIIENQFIGPITGRKLDVYLRIVSDVNIDKASASLTSLENELPKSFVEGVIFYLPPGKTGNYNPVMDFASLINYMVTGIFSPIYSANDPIVRDSVMILHDFADLLVDFAEEILSEPSIIGPVYKLLNKKISKQKDNDVKKITETLISDIKKEIKEEMMSSADTDIDEERVDELVNMKVKKIIETIKEQYQKGNDLYSFEYEKDMRKRNIRFNIGHTRISSHASNLKYLLALYVLYKKPEIVLNYLKKKREEEIITSLQSVVDINKLPDIDMYLLSTPEDWQNYINQYWEEIEDLGYDPKTMMSIINSVGHSVAIGRWKTTYDVIEEMINKYINGDLYISVFFSASWELMFSTLFPYTGKYKEHKAYRDIEDIEENNRENKNLADIVSNINSFVNMMKTIREIVNVGKFDRRMVNTFTYSYLMFKETFSDENISEYIKTHGLVYNSDLLQLFAFGVYLASPLGTKEDVSAFKKWLEEDDFESDNPFSNLLNKAGSSDKELTRIKEKIKEKIEEAEMLSEIDEKMLSDLIIDVLKEENLIPEEFEIKQISPEDVVASYKQVDEYKSKDKILEQLWEIFSEYENKNEEFMLMIGKLIGLLKKKISDNQYKGIDTLINNKSFQNTAYMIITNEGFKDMLKELAQNYPVIFDLLVSAYYKQVINTNEKNKGRER